MRLPAILNLAAAGVLAVTVMAQGQMMAPQGGDTVLRHADMQKLLPASVFYRAQVATTQLRNSGGVKFADGYYVLATMVDTSGYSSEVTSKYQACFIAEVPIKVGGQNLPAGAYGIGFIANGKFVVTDIGAHDVLTVDTDNDAGLKRPVPMQVTADPASGYRLYAGRRYVIFSR